MKKETTLQELETKKRELLAQYKALQEPLEYAQNDFEVDLIQQKRQTLANQIKDLASQINTQTHNA